MKYTNTQFIALMEAVEEQGGEHLLGERCKARRFQFVGEKSKDVTLPYCGRDDTLFELPYEQPSGEVAPITVCALDDGMGLWPRFNTGMASR